MSEETIDDLLDLLRKDGCNEVPERSNGWYADHIEAALERERAEWDSSHDMHKATVARAAILKVAGDLEHAGPLTLRAALGYAAELRRIAEEEK